MGFEQDLDAAAGELSGLSAEANEWTERFSAELKFAADLASVQKGGRKGKWQELVLDAAKTFAKASAKSPVQSAVEAAEKALEPLAEAAKEYIIHCVGHAHIDMNWMWSWPETVATVNDTFTTVDRLMDEFPDFHFSQSQASIYAILADYLPELAERVKKRIAEGRWEVTASHWVEADKNLASGEILCRHLLYTRRYLREHFDVGEPVRIDWECDTFGHARSIPMILEHGGVTWYYFHRSGPGPRLFRWQSPDGSQALAFDDRDRGYNGRIDAGIVNGLLEYEAATKLKDYLFVYGVGDHGGGPTRRDLVNARKMAEWPIWPNVKLSTAAAFFSAVETQPKGLPVVEGEMNFVFEGCYTSQAPIKHANRTSENALVEAEAWALLAGGLAKLPYPTEALSAAWRHAMFNQFHDILPGSNTGDSRHYALGLFQEVMAQTSMIKTRALRAIAAKIDTAACCRCDVKAGKELGDKVGPGIGGGPGDMSAFGMPTRYSGGEVCCDPVVVFNTSPWPRSEVVTARVWDREWSDDRRIVVRDDRGKTVPAQVLSRGNFWAHQFIDVAFPAADVGGLGWRSCAVARASEGAEAPAACSADGKGTIENEFCRVEVERASGTIVHLVDKASGVDLVPPGERIGVLEMMREAPHGMTAWVLGQIVERRPMLEGGMTDCPERGPWRATVRTRHRVNESTFEMRISLSSGVPRVDFELNVDWHEKGTNQTGVPVLRVAFPLAVEKPTATFECPNGFVERSTDPKEITSNTTLLLGRYFKTDMPVDPAPGEVPAQKWADLTGKQSGTREPVGATLLNDSKYGHAVDGSTLRLTLLRGTSDPDPLPDLGRHVIRFALRPHVGAWTPGDSTRAGYEFNMPLNVVAATKQKGKLPAQEGYTELLTPGVCLSGMKKAEDSSALIVRLCETDGKAVTAKMRIDEALVDPKADAVECDVHEQPAKKSSAKFSKGILSVDVPAFGMVSVKLG